jgi:hypothetical protein
MLFEHGHDGDNAWLAAGGEGVEFEVGGHEGGGEFSVCCGTGTSTPNLRRDIVELLAVLYMVLVNALANAGASQPAYLVCDYGTARGTSIGSNDNTSIVESADNGGTGRCGLRERDSSGVEGKVAVVV